MDIPDRVKVENFVARKIFPRNAQELDLLDDTEQIDDLASYLLPEAKHKFQTHANLL